MQKLNQNLEPGFQEPRSTRTLQLFSSVAPSRMNLISEISTGRRRKKKKRKMENQTWPKLWIRFSNSSSKNSRKSQRYKFGVVKYAPPSSRRYHSSGSIWVLLMNFRYVINFSVVYPSSILSNLLLRRWNFLPKLSLKIQLVFIFNFYCSKNNL